MRPVTSVITLFALALVVICAQAQQKEPVHSLSLRVLANGSEVMTPNLQVHPDTPAYVSYTAKGQDEPSYSLQVIMLPHTKVAGKVGDAVKAVLWKGGVKQSDPVMDSIVLLKEATGKTGRDPQSIKLIDSSGTTYEIQVVSHAVFMKKGRTFG